MAKEKKYMGHVKFVTAIAVITGIGYLLGQLAMWSYENQFKAVSLGFGESILILGALAIVIYSIMGLGIAIAYNKFIQE